MSKQISRSSLPIISIILIGTTLRMINIDDQSLWLDEYFSYFLAIKDVPGIVAGTAADILPPLYYFFLHGALRIGTDETIIRTVSLFFSVMTIPLVYVFAKTLYNRKVGLMAALLLAISPLHILFAQEARMYTMFAFLITVASYLFWKAWERDRLLHWFFFAISTTLAFYTHSLAIFCLLAIDVYCLIDRSRLRIRWQGLIAAHVTIFILFLPWVVRMFGQVQRLQSEFAGASQSILTLITAPFLFIFGYSLKESLIPIGLFAALVLVAFSLLSIWYAIRLRQPESSRLLFAICLFIVPVIGVYLLSFIWPIFVLRRLLPASIGLILVISWTIIEAKPKWLNSLVGLAVCIIMILSVVNYYHDSEIQKIPFRDVVSAIKVKATSGDRFVHASDSSALAFAYYAPELDSYFLSGDPDYVQETNRGRAQKIAGLEATDIDSITDDIDEFWMIVVLDHNLEYQSDLVDEFDAVYKRLNHESIFGVDVLHYALQTGSSND